MKKILLSLLLLCSNAFGQAGFETGNLNSWTTSGGDATASQAVSNLCTGGGKCWTINPYGSWMGKLYPTSVVQFNAATTSLGLTSVENNAIRQFMTANAGGGNPTPTDASWMKRTMTLTAGTTYSFAWNYVSTDYTPFNDGSMVTLVHSTNASIVPTLNNSQQRYGLLGFTNPGTGNYATDSYGSTGWQKVIFTVPQTGDYVLGFATFNLGDTALSPILFVDEIQGTTLLNGTSFGPIAPNPGSTAPPATTPTPAAPNWQTIKTNSTPVVISNIYPTSNNSPSNEGAANAFDGNPNTKYLNFDKQNAGVTVKLSQGRVVKKFTITTANDAVERDPASYKLYGSNDGVNWVLLSEGPLSLSNNRFAVSDEIAVANTNAYVYYFIKFPSIKNDSGNSVQVSEVTYYYDLDDGVTSTDSGTGGTPSNPGQAGSVCADCAPSWPATSDISIAQTAQRNAAKTRVANIVLGNHLYLEQKIGSSGNAVTIEQTGNYNKIAGLGGGTYAVIDGDNNTVNIKQGDTLGKNLIEFSVTGNTNNITLWQARNPTTGLQDGQESGGHYMGLNINGSTNTLSLKQSNDGGASSGHFAYVDVTGNNNQGTLKQMGNGEKTFFGIINGSTNVFDITQQGSGSYFDLALTGNGHSVTANQKDAGSHKATINLTNSGGASNVTLIQQGSAAQNINITQQCATLSGCSVSVTQGTGP
jgi:hypothetical protein